jgi:predicted nucleic acid-binding protein
LVQEEAPLVLDAGAVIALARGNLAVRRFINEAARAQTPVLVPAVVVAETIRGRGPRDAPVERALAKAREVLAADDAIARIAGALLAAARSDATIDAIVVAHALQLGGAVVMTSDPDDLRSLAPHGSDVWIRAV